MRGEEGHSAISKATMALALFQALTSSLLSHLYALVRTSSSWISHLLHLLSLTKPNSSSLPALSNCEKVSDHTYRILGQNPGPHTLQGSNIYIVTNARTHEAFIVDAGEAWAASKMIPLLLQTLESAQVRRVKAVLLTHGHADHQGGVKAIMASLAERNMFPLPIVYKRAIPNDPHPAQDFDCHDIQDGQMFSLDEVLVQALYTPGHTPDHVAFLLPGDRAVLTGDCVLGCGTAVFDDLASYMASLQKLRKIFQDSAIGANDTSSTNIASGVDCSASLYTSIYPGHGPVIREGLQKVAEYILHREKREEQLMEALKGGETLSSLQLVHLVYGDSIPRILVLSAQANLLHHLEKLQGEGKVQKYKYLDLWKINI
jgi:endoribonuclease LACTB2